MDCVRLKRLIIRSWLKASTHPACFPEIIIDAAVYRIVGFLSARKEDCVWILYSRLFFLLWQVYSLNISADG
jgi:hypothetical protein